MSSVPQITNRPAPVVSLVERLPAVIPYDREELDGDLWIEVIENIDGPGGLIEKVTEWDDLARNAVEPNVFYESWQLLPALRLFSPSHCRFVLVYRRAKRPDVPTRLCGFFPFIVTGNGLRAHRWSLWQHDYCFLAVPLIRRAHATEVWSTLFHELSQMKSGPQLLDMPLQCGEGELAQAMTTVLYDRSALVEHVESYTRAFVRKSEDWTIYAAAAMSTHQRRELRRHWRRFSESGELTERTLESNQGDEVESWIDNFLELEARGWKGESGSAIHLRTKTSNYFQEIVRAAYQQDRLQMFGLFLQGEPVALKVNFLAGTGAFAFKIAYDERFSKYSPGVQLELDNLRRLHEAPGHDWIDSCAVPRHFMINRLWKERRTISHLRVSLGGWMSNLEIGGRVLLRAVRRAWTAREGVADRQAKTPAVKSEAQTTSITSAST